MFAQVDPTQAKRRLEWATHHLGARDKEKKLNNFGLA